MADKEMLINKIFLGIYVLIQQSSNCPLSSICIKACYLAMHRRVPIGEHILTKCPAHQTIVPAISLPRPQMGTVTVQIKKMPCRIFGLSP